MVLVMLVLLVVLMLVLAACGYGCPCVLMFLIVRPTLMALLIIARRGVTRANERPTLLARG